MKQTESKLTNQDVHYLLGTIDIAEGETGGDYSDLKNKLFALYPQVKKETDDYAEREQIASDEQDSRRATVTQIVIDDLDLGRLVLPQLATWIANEDNWKLLSDSHSDEICLAGDLWKYHLDDMITSGLTEELRNYLDEEEAKRDTWWVKGADKTDDELWHTLIRILEDVRRNLK